MMQQTINDLLDGNNMGREHKHGKEAASARTLVDRALNRLRMKPLAQGGIDERQAETGKRVTQSIALRADQRHPVTRRQGRRGSLDLSVLLPEGFSDRAKQGKGLENAGLPEAVAGGQTVANVAMAVATALWTAGKLITWQNRYRNSILGSLNDEDLSDRFQSWLKSRQNPFPHDALQQSEYFGREQSIARVEEILRGRCGDKAKSLLQGMFDERKYRSALADFRKREAEGEQGLERVHGELARTYGVFLRKYFADQTRYEAPWIELQFRASAARHPAAPGIVFYNQDSGEFVGLPKSLPPTTTLAQLKDWLKDRFGRDYLLSTRTMEGLPADFDMPGRFIATDARKGFVRAVAAH